jgi:hypothetical protein
MYTELIDKSKLITLEEETHTYKLKNSDIKFQSVTEFIHSFFKPFEEEKVAKKLTSSHPKYLNKTPEELIKIWNSIRYRGTLVHKEIEEFILSKKKRNTDPKTIQAIDFLKTKCIKKSNILIPELIIYSEKLKLAGTIDLLIYNKLTNTISIIDWKTNKKITKKAFRASETGLKWPTSKLPDCNFTHYTLQLSLYKYILKNIYQIAVNGIFLIHLKEDKYELHHCDYNEETITNMLQQKNEL